MTIDIDNLPLRGALGLLAIASLLSGGPAIGAGARPDDTSAAVAAQTRKVSAALHAYAQVRPVALLPARARAPGIVSGLHLRPGDRVAAGDVLAALKGPDIDAALAKRNADVRSAKAELEAARQSLQVRHQQKTERLGTRLQVYEAKGRVVRARAALQSAQAALAAAKSAERIVAPVDATIVKVRAANGQAVRAGEALVVLQGSGSLWLRARFYGQDADAVHTGMKGLFQPTDGHQSIPVRVRDVGGTVGKDGGRQVGLIATDAKPAWDNGQAGTVTLKGPARVVVTVPSRALILDGGQWWVLVSKDDHLHPQRVVPGVHRGDWTAIAKGLTAGERVVVRDAYLRFHRGVSGQYQPPD